MQEKNEPILFVNSVSVYRSNKEISKTKLHRLDDIKVLLNLNQEVLVEIECIDMKIKGVVNSLNSNEIKVINENCEITLNLSKIKEIKIVSSK